MAKLRLEEGPQRLSLEARQGRNGVDSGEHGTVRLNDRCDQLHVLFGWLAIKDNRPHGTRLVDTAWRGLQDKREFGFGPMDFRDFPQEIVLRIEQDCVRLAGTAEPEFLVGFR